MKIISILIAIVACAVAVPVVDYPSYITPSPRTLEEVGQLAEKAAKDAELHATNAKDILNTIRHLEEGPRTKETLVQITKFYNFLKTESQQAERAEKRAYSAFYLKEDYSVGNGVYQLNWRKDSMLNRAIDARRKAHDDRMTAQSIQKIFRVRVEAYARRQAEQDALEAQQERERQQALEQERERQKQERERQERERQERERYRQSFRGRLARFFGFDRDATEADSGKRSDLSAVEPAQSRSMITIMKENPVRTAVGAAVGLAALASIYALIARRRSFAKNATITTNSTAVPSSISAPINATVL